MYNKTKAPENSNYHQLQKVRTQKINSIDIQKKTTTVNRIVLN